MFASRSIPVGLASSLLIEVCAGDSRIVCTGATVSLAGAPDPLLEEAEFVVFDLETTGLSAQTSRICELGAVRVRALELVDGFQSLVDPPRLGNPTVPDLAQELEAMLPSEIVRVLDALESKE